MGGVTGAAGSVTDERTARLLLARLAEPGDQRVGEAVRERGAVALLEALGQGRSGLAGEEHLRARLPEGDLHFSADADQAALGRCGGRFVVPGDLEWPTQLDALDDARPLGLFVRGQDLRLAALRSVAVVGARAASQYGLHVASELTTDLAERGWTVVSGGAYGIDAAAHRGALAATGATVAVLACGVDVAYPKGNTTLIERIGVEGTVVAELPPGCAPTRVRFLQRNRVIAALTRGTVVVEAALRSGALSTAAAARRLGRPVLGVPGPVTSPMSAGVHDLLRRDDPARLVTSADEVVEEVGMIGELAPELPRPQRVRDALDPTSLRVLEATPVWRAVAADRIARTAGLTLDVVAGELVRLQLAGLVEARPGGWRLAASARTSGPPTG